MRLLFGLKGLRPGNSALRSLYTFLFASLTRLCSNTAQRHACLVKARLLQRLRAPSKPPAPQTHRRRVNAS